MEVRRALTPAKVRLWEPVGVAGDSTDGFLKFKVMSYNILAQSIIEGNLCFYRLCARRDLMWEVRSERLYDEIKKISPDILCLQELDSSHAECFLNKFAEIGYRGIFKKKTGDMQVDGCAIYFKRSVFKLEDVNYVEFYQPKLWLLNRHQIGIMVKLTPLNMPDTPFVVATTHLLYSPRRMDIRLAQMRLFLAEIDRFAYYRIWRDSGYLPIILAGDFNDFPDSKVVKLLDKGQTSFRDTWNHTQWNEVGVTDNCQHLSVYLNRLEGLPTDFSELNIDNSEYEASSGVTKRKHILSSANKLNQGLFSEMFNSGIVSYPLNLRSVYNVSLKDKNGYYISFAYNESWSLVDYMYCSAGSSLKPLERLSLPTTKQCSLFGLLPNDKYPSDHLSLAAVFQLQHHHYSRKYSSQTIK